jgi:hypothetical protein
MPQKKDLKAYYYYKDDKVSQPKQSIDLKILHPLPTAKKPEIFQMGIMLSSSDMCLKGEAVNLWADLLRRCGLDYITMMEHMTVTEPGSDRNVAHYYRAFKKQGIKVFLEPFFLGGHGYDMGYWLCRPLSGNQQFIRIDGSISTRMANPHWMINSPVFKKKLYDYLYDLTVKDKRCDSFAVNWEPWPYHMMDFSDETLEDFAIFIGKDPAEIKKTGRLNFIKKNKPRLIDFRNKQLADLMKTIYDTLKELEPKAGHKLDMMAYVNGHLEKDYANYPGEIGRHDRKIATFLYPSNHYFLKDYRGSTNQFASKFPGFVKELRKHRQWAIDQNPQNPPGLYDCAGFNGSSAAIVPPAQMRLQILLDMIYGYKGAAWYRWYGGYDGRYYYTLAKISEQIVELEPYLCDKEIKAEKGSSAAGYPGKTLLNIKEGEWTPEFVASDLFNAGAYRIAYLANLQEKWEAEIFWKLDLPEGEYDIFDPLTKAQLSIGGKTKISAEDMKNGLYFKFMPNEIKILIIRKWSDKSESEKTFKSNSNAADFEKAKGLWEKALKARPKEKAKPPKKVPALINIKEQQNDSFKIYSKGARLFIECKNEKFIFDVAKGARLISWKTSGFEQVNSSSMLMDSLWEEKKDVWKIGFKNSEYKIEDIGMTEESLKIKFTCAYPHETVKLNKTFSFSKDGKLNVEVELKNTGKDIIIISYWLQNWPEILNRKNVKDGEWLFQTSEGFKKNNSYFTQAFYVSEKLPQLDFLKLTPFKLQFQKQKITGNKNILYSKQKQMGTLISTEPQKTAAYYTWDSLSSSFKTCDIIFTHVSLQPGETWKTSFSLQSLGPEDYINIIKMSQTNPKSKPGKGEPHK